MVVLNDSLSQYDLSTKVLYYTDITNKVTIGQLIANDSAYHFIKSEKSPVNLGVSNLTHWFVFSVENRSSELSWLTKIDYPTLNDVTFYIVNQIGKIDTTIHLGLDYDDEVNRNIFHNIFFNHLFRQGEIYKIYARIKTDSFIIVPISIVDTQTFVKNDRNEIAFLYLFYGLILAFLLLNIILYILTFEKSYLLLSVYMFLLITNSYYLYGYGVNFLPKLNPYLFSRMKQILFGVASLVFFIFSINYLNLKKYRVIYRIYLGFICLCLIYIPVVFSNLIPRSFLSEISSLLYAFGGIIIFSSGIYIVLKKERLAIYYVLSFSVFVVASVIYTLTLFGKIPFGIYTIHINSIAAVLFGVLLTTGLIEKITAIKREKARAHHYEKVSQLLQMEINERSKTEKALRESEEKFRLLFELSPQPISVTEFETGFVLDVNNQMEKIIGISKKELLSKTTLQLNVIDSNVRKEIISRMNQSSHLLDFEIELHPKVGDPVDCLMYSQIVEFKGKKALISVFSDISELKRRQQEIRKLSTAIEQSATSVIITNLKGEIEYMNPVMQKMTGYHISELAGTNPSILKSGYHSESFYKNLWKTILDGKTWSGEFYNKKKDNTFFWDLTTITPIFDEKGSMTNFIAIKKDVTESKKQQEALRKSEEKLRELNITKDKFFSIIAHDLMNPFNALLGYIGLLSEAIDENRWEECSGYTKIIDESSRRVFNLLENLLMWSRAQNGKLNYSPLHVKVIELVMNAISVINWAANKKNIKVDIDLDENDLLFLDQNMIGSVIRNLTSNAIKFSKPGGKITVAVKNKQTSFLFSVSDDGVGMDNEALTDLFSLEKTITSKGTTGEPGTGLGLVLCYEFVTIHNGKIWAESKPGEGSTFYFTIPVVLPEQ